MTMDIKSAFAAQTYLHARPATEPVEQPAAKGAEASGFSSLFSDFAQTLRQGEEVAKAAMTGDADAHSLVEALAASELAVETTVTLRNKVVEAYQEILRMQV